MPHECVYDVSVWEENVNDSWMKLYVICQSHKKYAEAKKIEAVQVINIEHIYIASFFSSIYKYLKPYEIVISSKIVSYREMFYTLK